MSVLSAGVDYIDLQFLGSPGIIATAILHGPAGVALVDPGPSTCLPTLWASLGAKGIAASDIRAILLTHIHLDHAGATGSLVEACPAAQVYVHERGAKHLVDPSKLLASATRLYGADMDRLWGEVKPVKTSGVVSLEGDTSKRHPMSFSITGREIEIIPTPGHAQHHVSYFDRASGVAFVGDTAGICRPSGRVVLPPTPPPDIDLEAWRESTRRILAWNPDLLFLTHFGPHGSPRVHFQDLWTRMDDWSRRVRALLDAPGTDESRAAAFAAEVTADLQRLTNADEARAYARAGRFDFSFAGLARYWLANG